MKNIFFKNKKQSSPKCILVYNYQVSSLAKKKKKLSVSWDLHNGPLLYHYLMNQ